MRIRSLTDSEKEVILKALMLLSRSKEPQMYRQAAASMLTQDMPENFLWIQQKD